MVFATPLEAVEFASILPTELETWRQPRGIALCQRVGMHLGRVVIEASYARSNAHERRSAFVLRGLSAGTAHTHEPLRGVEKSGAEAVTAPFLNPPPAPGAFAE